MFDRFKRLILRKSMLQFVKFLILHNPVPWVQETDFKKSDIKRYGTV